MASLVATKKSSNGLPAEPNFPSAVPNTTLNITIPRTFVVAEFTCLKSHAYKGTAGRWWKEKRNANGNRLVTDDNGKLSCGHNDNGILLINRTLTNKI